MCEWGNIIKVKLCKPQKNALGESFDIADVDTCIAPIVQALNNIGIETVASCCGHGKSFGNIALKDGRELIICPNYETARKLDQDMRIDTS